MKEKVNISDINIPNNFKDIKTNYKITLYDKDTGEIISSTDGHNKLNPNLGLRAWSLTYGSSLTNAVHVPMSNSPSYDLPYGIYFYNSIDDPSTNHVAGPQRGTFIGGGQLGVSDSAAMRCSYNPTESKFEIVYEDGIAYMHKHIVMDATTSQLNGEINTVVIGSNRYLLSAGIFEAGLYVYTSYNTGDTVYDHNKPLYGRNASLMSYHPDRPSWQKSSTSDTGAYGSWSFESDNTAWFSPYRKSNITNVDDIVLFHYDLTTWKVLDTIKLALPQECLGKELLAYKFDDCIGLYCYNGYAYSESSGNPNFYSNNLYIFNLNGDFVKSVSRSLNSFTPTRLVAIEDKLYFWPMTTNTTYRALLVLDSELNLQDSVVLSDYWEDSRYGYSSSYGKFIHYMKPIVLLDNITGERKLLLNACGYNNSNYAGSTNLVWNINKGQVEWQTPNSITEHCYAGKTFSTSYVIPAVINGIGYTLPADTSYGTTYWPRHWQHWCKLSSPVTKTANTTMKIQIDLYYPIVSPFTFMAPPDPPASSTESE